MRLVKTAIKFGFICFPLDKDEEEEGNKHKDTLTDETKELNLEEEDEEIEKINKLSFSYIRSKFVSIFLHLVEDQINVKSNNNQPTKLANYMEFVKDRENRDGS